MLPFLFGTWQEHCLVGRKGNPQCNRCVDTDVLVAEVRRQSGLNASQCDA